MRQTPFALGALALATHQGEALGLGNRFAKGFGTSMFTWIRGHISAGALKEKADTVRTKRRFDNIRHRTRVVC